MVWVIFYWQYNCFAITEVRELVILFEHLELLIPSFHDSILQSIPPPHSSSLAVDKATLTGVLHRRTSEDCDKIPIQDCSTLFYPQWSIPFCSVTEWNAAKKHPYLGGRSFSPDPCCIGPPNEEDGRRSREAEPDAPPNALPRLLGWVLLRLAVNRSPKSGRSANLFSKLSRFGLKSPRWSRFSSR